MSWKEALATVAPTIATALGGPVAGMAAKVACDALGIEGNDEAALEAAVASGDPEVLVKLKQAENDFKVELKRLGIEEKKLDVQDRGSARELAKARGIIVQALLTGVFVVLFSWLLALIFTGEEVVHPTMRDIANFLLGTLTGGLIQILNFWFGSSEGSKRKTNMVGSGQ